MDNRERILDAARQVYAVHGFRGATTRRIAGEAGVNEVTVFRLFGSKAQLIDEMRGAVFDADRLPTLPPEPRDPEAEVTVWCRGMLDILTANRSIIRKMMSEVEEDPSAGEGACHGPMCAKQDLERYVQRLAESGRTAPDADPRTSMTMLVSALFGDAMTREMMPDVKPPFADAPRLYTRAFLRSLGLLASIILLFAGAAVTPLAAQQRALSLEEAIRLAEGRSEAVRVARAGSARAEGQYLQARSGRQPQLAALVQYQRTLRSQFAALAGGGAGPDSGGIDFSSVGFGAANQWVAGLDFSQNLFTFGRLSGAAAAADAARRVAAIELVSQRASTVLDIAQAYYDAALAQRIVAIADSTRGQTEEVLRQTQLARQVGSAAEFDLLRAQVANQNTLPVAIAARGAQAVAFLRLKQLLDIPLEEEVTLTTAIDESPEAIALPAGLSVSSIPAGTTIGDTSSAARSVVRQAEENVRAREALVRVAHAERYPAVALTSSYQRLFFPKTVLPNLGRYSENWTVGVGARVTLLSGGRVRGGEIIARADADDARARLDQVRELAALDVRLALNGLAQAQAAWAASQGTVEQAQRAYRIDQVRFTEGIATQSDLSQTRLLLQQATANRATAARDLAVARVRLALIPDLPLGAGGGLQGAGMQGAPQQPGQGGVGGESPQQQQGSSAQGARGAAATSLGGTPQ